MGAVTPEQRLCPNCRTPLRDNEDGCGFPPRASEDERLARIANAIREYDHEARGFEGYLAWEYLQPSEQGRWLGLARVAVEAGA